MAAYYPEEPSPEEKEAATTFINSFMQVGIEHPDWGAKFLKNMNEFGPPDVSNTASLSVWMCHQHNKFNEDLGKPLMSCDYGELKKRWGGPARH